MKHVIYISTTIILISCSFVKPDNKNKNIANDSIKFNKYINQIKKMDLPFNLDCYRDVTCISDSLIDGDLIKRFKHKDLIVGRLFESNNYYSIIYASIGDILYPTLFTFKKDGLVIDSIYLFSIDCGDSPKAWTHAFSIIDGDGTITMMDSTGVYLSDSTDITDSVLVNIQKIRLDESGRFNKLCKESRNVKYEKR
jgi:hypothetical protein